MKSRPTTPDLVVDLSCFCYMLFFSQLRNEYYQVPPLPHFSPKPSRLHPETATLDPASPASEVHEAEGDARSCEVSFRPSSPYLSEGRHETPRAFRLQGFGFHGKCWDRVFGESYSSNDDPGNVLKQLYCLDRSLHCFSVAGLTIRGLSAIYNLNTSKRV